MRIVLILPTYYPDSSGGAERQTRILAQALRRQGVEATLLAPTNVASAAGTTIDQGVPTVRLFTRYPVFLGGRYVTSMLSWWLSAFLWLARNRDRYDVISIQHVRLHAAPGILAGILFRKPMTGKLGRGGAHFDMLRMRRQTLPFGRWVAKLAKRSHLIFAANSAEIVDDLRQEGIPEPRIFRVPNGVECPALPLAAHRDDNGVQVYVFVGRLHEEKGLPALIESFRTFAREAGRVRLDIYGEGPLRSTLDALVQEPGVADIIRLCGNLDDRDIIYGKAAFLVLPSDSEGMSNSLLEAMAYGVVPMITQVSGARDVVDDPGSGIVLLANDPPTILEGLRRAAAMSREEWASAGSAARGKMLSSYSINAVASAYLDLYRELLSDRSSSGGVAAVRQEA